jgi:hypothetical protein
MITEDKTLERPEGLSKAGQKAYTIIMEFLKEKDLTFTGGCKAFCSPKEWGERFGNNSELVVVHDGGDLAKVFNLDYMEYKLNNAMTEELRKHGLFFEQCTSWYSAVYPT